MRRRKGWSWFLIVFYTVFFLLCCTDISRMWGFGLIFLCVVLAQFYLMYKDSVRAEQEMKMLKGQTTYKSHKDRRIAYENYLDEVNHEYDDFDYQDDDDNYYEDEDDE